MATLEDNQAELVRGAVGSGQQEAKKEGAAPAKKKKFVVVHNPENSRDKKSPERRPQTQKSAAKPAARPAAARPAAAKPATAPAGTTASAGTTAAPAASTAAPKREGAAAPAARSARPAADRPANGERRSYGDRPQGNRDGQGRGDRPGYNRGDRPQGNRDGQGRGDRPGYNRGDRPQGNRDGQGRGDRPAYNRGDRPQGNRDGQGRGDRPGYNRDGQGRGDRPGYNRDGQGRGGDRPQNGGRDSRGGQGARGGAGRQMSRSFDTPVETKPENRRYDNRNHQKQEKQYKDEDISKLKNKPGRFIKPEPQPVVKKDSSEPRKLQLPEMISISDLADRMKIQPSAIIKKLFLEGKMLTVNSELDFEAAGEIALEYNFDPEPEVKEDVIGKLLEDVEDPEDTLVQRPPVVCVMGHVDHGKTSLLDAIRHTNVIDREAGGITQHIGAYVVEINGEKITFLDTPGHEAFTAMRMRGASSTDIAVLVVAADDGVMPQTVEAINHAKAAGVEIIVAVNKMDKPSANIDRVKQELTEYELIPEDWGGSTIFVPVSAKTGEGLEDLMEMIALTAEVMELKANPNRRARGLVLEAKLDKGRGSVANILVQKGTLRVGDPIAAGSAFGKVRAMMDDKGRRVKEAGPSTPVEILGLNDVPNAGEVIVGCGNEKEARNFAETFISQSKVKLLEETKSKLSLDDLFTQIQEGNLKELGIVVKADVQGSVEAIKQSLLKLSNDEVVVKIIHGGVGAINESDVSLASASNAIIIGFNVRPDATAKETADREGVDIRLYRVIYNAIEDVEAAMKGMLDPVFEEKVLGHAEVRQTFKASGVGTIAGSYVLDGLFKRDCSVRLTRDGIVIFEGPLASLKRFKDDVKEVKAGYECGFVFANFNDIKEGDLVEAFEMVEIPR